MGVCTNTVLNESTLAIEEIAFLVSILAFLLSVLGVILKYKTYLRTKELKSIEITYDFQKRFESIYSDFNKGDKTEDDIERYFLMFWNFQVVQYQYYQKGYVDATIFNYWMLHRIQEFKYSKVKDITYKDGWKKASERIPLKPFKDMINEISEIKLDDNATSKIYEILKKH